MIAFCTYVDRIIDDADKTRKQLIAEYDTYARDFLAHLAGEDLWADRPRTEPDETGRQLAYAFRPKGWPRRPGSACN